MAPLAPGNGDDGAALLASSSPLLLHRLLVACQLRLGLCSLSCLRATDKQVRGGPGLGMAQKCLIDLEVLMAALSNVGGSLQCPRDNEVQLCYFEAGLHLTCS